jgi:hypothetical protein
VKAENVGISEWSSAMRYPVNPLPLPDTLAIARCLARQVARFAPVRVAVGLEDVGLGVMDRRAAPGEQGIDNGSGNVIPFFVGSRPPPPLRVRAISRSTQIPINF